MGPLTSMPISSTTVLICFRVNGWSYISVFIDGNTMTGVSFGLVALIKLVFIKFNNTFWVNKSVFFSSSFYTRIRLVCFIETHKDLWGAYRLTSKLSQIPLEILAKVFAEHGQTRMTSAHLLS
jgi:hypothetical protein